MSDSQVYEAVTTSSNGVTVVKRFEEDEFPVPAIAFEFASERDEAVTVRLSDAVPEGVEVEDLGFHPEYGSEFWTIDEETITFEKEIPANAEYTTVYGIRATGADDVEQFLTEPVIESVDPPLSGADGLDDDLIPESGDDVVKDAISGDGEVPGLEDETEDEEEDSEETTDEEIETLDLKDPNAPNSGGTTVTGDGADDDTEESSDTDVAVDGSVVSAIATEIRENDVSVDDLKLLQRAIDKLSERDEDSEPQTDGATEARIERLQSDIADLRAYTDALEEFLEENGTGEQLIAEFESELEQFGSRLDGFQSELSETSGAVDELDEDVEELDDDVDDLEAEMGDVHSDVDDVESTVSDLQGTIDDLESSVEELESEIDGGELDERVDSIEEDISELRDWQEQIRSTFGG